MRVRGGAAVVAVAAMVGGSVTGCGLLRDEALAPTAPGSTRSPSQALAIHPVPEAPAGVTDVWIPADHFVLSIVLAVSESGDALVAFTDDEHAWDGGFTSFGIATVTPDGTVDRLVEPGSILVDGALPFLGAVNDATAVVYLGGETSHTADRILMIDRQTGSAALSPPTFFGPDGESDELEPAADFVLVDDTAVWPQITSQGVGTLVSLSLDDDGVRVHATDDPLLDGALSDVVTVGRDYCTEHGFWMLGFDPAGKGPITSASGTVDADGSISVDAGSLVTPPEGRLSMRQLRCGASVLGSVLGASDNGSAPPLILTPDDPAGVAIGVSTDTAVPVAITRDWMVVEAGDPLESSRSLLTLISRHDDIRSTIKVDGPCALISPKVAGSTIAWVTGGGEANPLLPVGAACLVAVGTLASP